MAGAPGTPPAEQDHRFLSVCRYVERNPLRAGLVKRAEAWAWSSLAYREGKLDKTAGLLDDSRRWRATVNRPQDQQELDALRA